MIWILYLVLALANLYIFYQSKKFWQLSFLLVLGTSYLGTSKIFNSLPFAGRLLIFLLGLAGLGYFLYQLNKDYKTKKLEARRQSRQKKQEE